MVSKGETIRRKLKLSIMECNCWQKWTQSHFQNLQKTSFTLCDSAAVHTY